VNGSAPAELSMAAISDAIETARPADTDPEDS
jgi:hypothetical protein